MLELNLLFRNKSFVPACYNKSDSKICFQLAIMNQIRSFFYSILVSFPQSKLRLQSQNFVSNLLLQLAWEILFPTCSCNTNSKFCFQDRSFFLLSRLCPNLLLQLKFEACFPGSKLHFLNRRFLGEAKLLIINEIWSFVSRINVSFSES